MADGAGVAEVLQFLVASNLDAMTCLAPLVENGYRSRDQVLAMTNEDIKRVLPGSVQRRFMAAVRKRKAAGQDDGSSTAAGHGAAKRGRPALLAPEDDTAPAIAPVALCWDEEEKEDVLVNRSPVMIAWGAVVAERLGFDWDAALSLSSMVTSLNAKSKGASLGIYSRVEEAGNAPLGWTAVSVALLGRRFEAATKIHDGARIIRGVVNDRIARPSGIHGQLSRAFGTRLAVVVAALRNVAAEMRLDHLQEADNALGYRLYCAFRPRVADGRAGWGAKGRLHFSDIRGVLTDRQFLTSRAEPPSAPAPASFKVEVQAEHRSATSSSTTASQSQARQLAQQAVKQEQSAVKLEHPAVKLEQPDTVEQVGGSASMCERREEEPSKRTAELSSSEAERLVKETICASGEGMLESELASALPHVSSSVLNAAVEELQLVGEIYQDANKRFKAL